MRQVPVTRNLSTPESRAFWVACEATAAEVATWPDWKRAGINESQLRATPRPLARDDEFELVGPLNLVPELP